MAFYPGQVWAGIAFPLTRFISLGRPANTASTTRFIELAGEINNAMPAYVVNRTAEALNESRKP